MTTRVQLALELPTVALEPLNRLADLDFAIAFRVLEDDAYAQHYVRRADRRELILDNGFHELGRPCGWADLTEAARRVQADYIIVPDNHGPLDARDNLKELRIALDHASPRRLALVVAGVTCSEHAGLVQLALDEGVGMFCFSRMVNRLSWFRDLCVRLPMLREQRIHLLGLGNSVFELAMWRAERIESLSVDTSKPAKAALLGRTLEDGRLRGMPVSSKELFGLSMNEEQLRLCEENIRILRSACGKEEEER